MPLEEKKKALVELAFWAAVTLVAYLALRWLPVLFLPFLLGMMIAYIIKPLIVAVANGTRMGNKAAGVFCAIFFYLVVGFVLWVGVLFLLGGNLPGRLSVAYEAYVGPFLEELNNRIISLVAQVAPGMGTGVQQAFEAIDAMIQNVLVGLSDKAMEWLGNVAAGLPLFLLTLLFSIVSSVMICMDFDGALGFLRRQIPARWLPLADSLKDFLTRTLLRMCKGYLILAAIIFGILVAGFWILKVKSIWLCAFIVALLDILPAMGGVVVLVPWGLFQLIAGNYFQGSGLVLLGITIAVARQILEPRVIGKQVGLHPLATLTSMYAGLRAGGIWGLLLAPVLVLLARHVYKFYKQN